jgi:hypothetical protein
MKTLGVLMIVVLAGCASKPTLTELEEQALATGDWTEVEAREKGMSRLRRSTEQECPDGAAKVCVDNGGTPYCQCRGGRRGASLFEK